MLVNSLQDDLLCPCNTIRFTVKNRFFNGMECHMTSKKYFPSHDEDEFDLPNDAQYDQHRPRENDGDFRAYGKESHHRQARSKAHGAGSSHQSEKIDAPQTKFRNRER